MSKIIGYKHSKGIFTPKNGGKEIAYDNINLAITDTLEPSDGFGNYPDVIKLRNNSDYLQKIFGCHISADVLRDYVGKDCDIIYGKYGIEHIIVKGVCK